MNYNLTDKSILIIDDYTVMRQGLRDMLRSLGANKFYEADNGANAINMLQKMRFDIVFCDHNLGEGKNGQQILEEAKHRKLIDDSCLFFIVTAENNVRKLLGVLDCKPDEYLVKPFNTQQLDNRLQQHFKRKSSLHQVEQEVKKGNLLKAIQHLDHSLAGHDKKMHTFLLKRRAELAIASGDYTTAKKIYDNTLANRELPWALLGLGIIEFQQDRIDEAIQIFEQLIAEHPHFMEAYDWLIKGHEANQAFDELQQTLAQTVKLMPESILRQKKLAVVAEKNGDLRAAEKAYKSVVNIGKYSVHKSTDDFFGLAKVYNKTNATNEALKTLQQMRNQFEHSNEIELLSAILETELYQKQGMDELSNHATQKMVRLSEKAGDGLTKEQQLDMIRSCFLAKQVLKANELLSELIDNYIEDEHFLNDIRRALQDVNKHAYVENLIKDTQRKLVGINNQGVALFQQGKYQEATELFEQAIQRLPKNKTIRVNLLKVLVQDMTVGNFSYEKLTRCKKLMQEAEKVGVESQKLETLKDLIKKLENATKTA